jgi:hypothetical protein
MISWRVGVAVATVLAAICAVPVVIGYASGYDPELVYRAAVGVGVNAVTVGYILAWPIYSHAQADLARLTPLLEPNEATQARDELDRAFSNRGVAITRALGATYGLLAASPAIADAIHGRPYSAMHLWLPLLIPVLWATILPALWRLLLVTRFFYRLGGRVRVDLGDRRALGVFADIGLRHLLLIVIGLSVIPMQAILVGRLGPMDFVPPLIVTIPVAFAVLALPMWGIHRGIVAAKEAELERANRALRDAEADSERQLLWWLYRQQIAQNPEWPVAAGSATRIVLYVVIPPLAWVGAALVQDAVANVLGLH